MADQCTGSKRARNGCCSKRCPGADTERNSLTLLDPQFVGLIGDGTAPPPIRNSRAARPQLSSKSFSVVCAGNSES